MNRGRTITEDTCVNGEKITEVNTMNTSVNGEKNNRSKCNEYQRKWRKTDAGKLSVKNCNKKVTLARKRKRQNQLADFLSQSRQGKTPIIIKEVKHHLDKGRDIATIACWMNIPMSRISEAVRQILASKEFASKTPEL